MRTVLFFAAFLMCTAIGSVAESQSKAMVHCRLWVHANEPGELRTYPEVGQPVVLVVVGHGRGPSPLVLPADLVSALDIQARDGAGASVPIRLVGVRPSFKTGVGNAPSMEQARSIPPGEHVWLEVPILPRDREMFAPGAYALDCGLRSDRITSENGPVAIEAFEVGEPFVVHAVETPEDVKGVYQIRGVRALGRGDIAEAVSEYLEGARRVPDDDFWGPSLVEAYLRQGDEEAALKWFDRCREKLVTNRRATGAFNTLDRVAMVYADRGDRVEALRILELAMPTDLARKALDFAIDMQQRAHE